MQSSMLRHITEDFGNGGTIDGDVTITGDLTVSGGGSLSFDEILEGTQVIDVTSTEALLVRKNSDGGDVFTVDTTNSDVTIGGLLTIDQNSNVTGLEIDSEATSADVINIASPLMQTGIVIDVANADALTTGKIARFESNSSSTGTRNLIEIINDHASATGTTGLKIQQDSTGPALVAMGNVGIGTAAPATALEIESGNGIVRFRHGSNDAGTMGIDFAHRDSDTLVKNAIVSKALGGYGKGDLHFVVDIVDDSNPYTVTTDTKMLISGATGNVGIGNTTPDAMLTLSKASSEGQVIIRTHTADSAGSALKFQKSRNTTESGFTIVADGDYLGSIEFQASDNDSFEPGAAIRARINGTVSNDSATPTDLIFMTSSAQTFVERMRINSAGNVGIGVTDPNNQLMVGSSTGGDISVARDDSAITSGESLGSILFKGKDDGGSGIYGIGARIQALATETWNEATAEGTSLNFYTTDNTTATHDLRMTIDHNGSVGIGTAAPTGLFSIYKTGGAPEMIWEVAGNSGARNWGWRASGSAWGDFQLRQGSSLGGALDTARITILDGGNVGIGTATPDGPLHILTPANTHAILKIDTTTSNYNAIVQYAIADTVKISTGLNMAKGEPAFEIYDNTNSRDMMVLDANSRISLSNNDAGDYNTSFGHSVGASQTSTATKNTLMGHYAGNAITDGQYNTLIGANTGDSVTTASKLTLIGQNAGTAITVTNTSNVSDGTTAVGFSALTALTSGAGNTAVGYQAMDANATSDYNTAVGTSALGALTNDGDTGNTAVGWNAGLLVTSGVNNTLIGTVVGDGFDAERDNTFVGYASGTGAINGADYCVAIGSSSFQGAATQDGTVAIGYQSLKALTSGARNLAIGHQAMDSLTQGDDNIGIGTDALGSMAATDGNDQNIAIGSYALANAGASSNVASGNVAIGYSAGVQVTTADNTTAIGTSALAALTTGSGNVAVGKDAGDSITTCNNTVLIGTDAGQAITVTGSGDTDPDGTIAIGSSALTALTTGARNVAVGRNAGLGLTSSTDCTFIGYQAGEDVDSLGSTPAGCTYVGSYSGKNLDDGTHNTALGFNAMVGTTGGSSCNLNVGIGKDALKAITVGDNNTALGATAGDALVDGTKNTLLGYGTDAGSSGAENQTAIGYGCTAVNVSDTVTLGNADVTAVYMGSDQGAKVYAGGLSISDDGNAGPTTGQIGIRASVGDCSIEFLDVGVRTMMIGHDNGTGMFRMGQDLTTANNCIAIDMLEATRRIGLIDAHSPGALLDVELLDINSDNYTTSDDFYGIRNNIKVVGASSKEFGIDDQIFGVHSTATFTDGIGGGGFGGLTGGYFKSSMEETGLTTSGTVTGVHAIGASFAGAECDNLYGANISAEVDAGTIDNNVFGAKVAVNIDAGTVSGDVYGIYINNDSEINPAGSSFGLYIKSDTQQDNAIQTQDAVSVRFRVSDDGVVTSEGAMNASTGMDYAEYFESKDGKEIAVGTTVKLDGTKIVACSDGDTPIGVIRPVNSSSVVAGGQEFHWESMFMKDDYGADVWESYTVKKWLEEVNSDEYYSKRGDDDQYFMVEGSPEVKYTDEDDIPEGKKVYDIIEPTGEDKFYYKHRYHSDRIPDGVTAPEDAEVIEVGSQRQKLNPDYDASKTYKPREERDEWHIVGLLGQIPVTKGQPTGLWIKMKDVSDTVEMYFVK